MLVDIQTLPNAFTWADELPYPNWRIIEPWLSKQVRPRHKAEAVADVQRSWLKLLSKTLGGDYRVTETNNFLIASERGPYETGHLVEFVEDALATIYDALEDVVDPQRLGKLVLLIFTEEDDYTAYIKRYVKVAPTTPPAICLRGEMSHIAMHSFSRVSYQVLARELAHYCVTPLKLPVWLEEGVTQVLARVALSEPPLKLDPIEWGQHRAYWSFNGLDAFWAGHGMGMRANPHDLSCQFAELLVRAMNLEDGDKFNRFLANADAADGAEIACMKYFGNSLSHYVQQLLGEGTWSAPKPAAPATETPH